MKQESLSTFSIGTTYIGVVVGAGFASGQEILRFFNIFGNKGLVGLFLCTILFILFGYIIMSLGHHFHSRSHLEVIQSCSGKYTGPFFDFIITFFLFGTFTVMISGAGAMLEQLFHLPALWGSIMMSIITVLTVLCGISGVISSISFVVPFLFLSIASISLLSIDFSLPRFNSDSVPIFRNGLVQNWIWAAFLYVSYNITFSIAILAPLGAYAKNKKSILSGAILGGLGLGLGALFIYLALSTNLNTIINFEIPMLFIAGQLSPAIVKIYAVILIAEIYTTSVGNLYGFMARITPIKASQTQFTYITILTAVVGCLASRIGFSNFVKYLYPIMGYCGIIILINLLHYKKNRKPPLL